MPGQRRRILIVTFSFQGSVIPCMRFANRLMKIGADVTVCTSLSAVQLIDKQTIAHGLLLAPFSDGHDSGLNPPTTLQKYISDIATHGACEVAKIVTSAVAAGQPFHHLVYTIAVPWVARVANAHGVKSSLLWFQSATMLDLYYYYFNEYQDFISSNKDNPAFPINLPGLPPLTIADLPSYILPSNPKEHDFLVLLLKDQIDVLGITSRILVNTFKELEAESLRAIKKLEFLPIGPLVPPVFLDGKDSSDNSTGEDFFDKKEDGYISEFLNTKPKSSVVYVSFGTVATFSNDQMEEMAMGLLESCRPFLWVIRDTKQAEKLSKIEELKKHGMIVSWCSQVVVLSHQSIGCFVMHSGWNSTLETLVAGVPAVVLPQWSDQPNNAKMMEDVWRTGVKMRRREGDGVVEGKEVIRCVEMVMGDEDIKKNVEKWKELAREALRDHGSSITNLLAFLDAV